MSTLDAARLYRALDDRRTARGMTWRQVARACEISPPTLTRLGRGMDPCLYATVALCRWLGQPVETFLRDAPALPPPETLETAIVSILSRHVVSPAGRDAVLATLRAVTR